MSTAGKVCVETLIGFEQLAQVPHTGCLEVGQKKNEDFERQPQIYPSNATHIELHETPT
jgi:hypothetical protein